MGRNIDIVYVLDATGSMAHCIENVKKSLQDINTSILNHFTTDDGVTEVDMLRVKFVIFRDYKSEGANAIQESPFFERPGDDAKMEAFISSVSAYGGGDGPENGMEALFYAFKSDFANFNGRKDRQIIVLITDNDALELKARAACAGYPSDMVDYEGLKAMWIGADQSIKLGEASKRMLIFAPSGTKYFDLSKACNRVQFVATTLANGLNDIDFNVVIATIVATATA